MRAPAENEICSLAPNVRSAYKLLTDRGNSRSQELQDSVCDADLLLMSHVREHRQGNYVGGGPLGHREGALLVSEVFVGLLQMKWNRVVDAAANSGFCEVSLQRLPILHAHHVEVIHPLCPRRFHGDND